LARSSCASSRGEATAEREIRKTKINFIMSSGCPVWFKAVKVKNLTGNLLIGERNVTGY
jgi:hypothetical protein